MMPISRFLPKSKTQISFQWGEDPSVVAATFEDGLYVQVDKIKPETSEDA